MIYSIIFEFNFIFNYFILQFILFYSNLLYSISFYFILPYLTYYFTLFYFIFVGLLTENSSNQSPQIFNGPPTGEWRDGLLITNIITILWCIYSLMILFIDFCTFLIIFIYFCSFFFSRSHLSQLLPFLEFYCAVFSSCLLSFFFYIFYPLFSFIFSFISYVCFS